MDPNARPSADEALRDEWLVAVRKETIPLPKEAKRSSSSDSETPRRLKSPLAIDSRVCASIEAFSSYSFLHRMALMLIARRATDNETVSLRQIFNSFDDKDDGTIDASELRRAFTLHGKYSEGDIDRIFKAVDVNGDGSISWTEFLGATIETRGKVANEEFVEAFKHLDCDKNGYISTSDLREILGNELPGSLIDQIIFEADKTKDHKIWKDEFMALAKEADDADDTYSSRRRSVNDKEFRRSATVGSTYTDTSSSADSENGGSSELRAELFADAKAKSVRNHST